ncbi:MAG: hypothetical protein Q4G08_08790 [Capnocytophaga sp.]|nr:hypothetical protein [Capnocytophaga sp.]
MKGGLICYLALSLGMISCGEDLLEAENVSEDIKKKEILDVFLSNGISDENVIFDATLNKDEALVFETVEEFSTFLKEQSFPTTKEISGDVAFDDVPSSLTRRWMEPDGTKVTFYVSDGVLGVEGIGTVYTSRGDFLAKLDNSSGGGHSGGQFLYRTIN